MIRFVGIVLVLALWLQCSTPAEKIFLSEKQTYAADYIHPADFKPQPERGYWEGESKTVYRQITLYVFTQPIEAARQSEFLKAGQPAAARDCPGDHPAIANNRGVACLLLGNYGCAENELLRAGLNEDDRVRHNYRVLLKIQEAPVVVHK